MLYSLITLLFFLLAPEVTHSSVVQLSNARVNLYLDSFNFYMMSKHCPFSLFICKAKGKESTVTVSITSFVSPQHQNQSESIVQLSSARINRYQDFSPSLRRVNITVFFVIHLKNQRKIKHIFRTLLFKPRLITFFTSLNFFSFSSFFWSSD